MLSSESESSESSGGCWRGSSESEEASSRSLVLGLTLNRGILTTPSFCCGQQKWTRMGS